MPLHAASLKSTGSGAYNTNPQTCVSCGPYILEEWAPDRRIVLKANDKFTGKIKPHIKRLVYTILPAGTTTTGLARYQANEVDQAGAANQAELQVIQNDPQLKEQFKVNAVDFRTFYLFFDVNTPPYDKLAVRQAIAHAIDRETIVKAVLAPLALPAYSMLMPGFPDANSEGLKSLQAYDPEQAKKLLAEGGFPNGQGFPPATLIVRGGGPATDSTVTQAIAAGLKQVLGIDVQLQTQDSPTFMGNLNAKPTKVPMGWISYGMDYLDATNMLGVFKSGGRHSWKNDEFDKLLTEGGQLSGNPQKRSQMMQDAEKILVTEASAVFVYHALGGTLFKPYIKGPNLEPNRFGYNGEQWPGYNVMTLAIPNTYISKEVSQFRQPR
jgi:peptide/nickel transport system substrate-binding protein/oligopeptide transport system substrate-binding protein